MSKRKVILIIMDGWGIAKDPSVSAIDAANTPFYDEAIRTWSNNKLQASELAVGLPEGQMGNSEVGHMNIGAGRIVYQDLVRLNREVESGNMAKNETFRHIVDYCTQNNKPVHLMGLLSDGGVHSHIGHLKGLVTFLAEAGVKEIYIHAFTDGRDTSPTGGLQYTEELQAHLDQVGSGKIASVIGRYFAMDRDKRWPRVKKAYDLIVNGEGKPFESALDAIQDSYDEGVTDEFIEPRVIVEQGQPVAKLKDEDAVIFFNFRTDRGRQLTQVLTQTDMPEEGMHTLKLEYATMTRYEESFKNVHVLYEKDNISNGLGEVLANAGKSQIRIAETEKYPHVTFFFNGGREEPMAGEEHLLCPSPKVATYDLQPEMSAEAIRDSIIPRLEEGEVDFVCLNFANADMVGHTGDWDAAVKACETVDACTKAVVEAAAANGYYVLVTADHGNSDCMRKPDGSPHTAHTTSLVPMYLVDPEKKWKLKDTLGKLGDIAPTILTLMDMQIPEDMSGDILVEKA
ncbi:2,3-bisphosphoglycerate-independent phosphoglycerate mutase [Pontibacter sp. G13]|uniref:2,3-bisphosphoglycerate-independent phosphoglycerate mutase n=1 Tax=Pontibacter sp. G13 TaxID=3074898 RepID=UPI00288B7447|nr:2,3-bisphosphoglycerate-independent phosphoglycerate mutase [Pontibacter sp. G13]WNJ17603.1 2,3-bisphosphoglycerate-independent phosphoglycerate mutase [Pontibacter sp. G13]